MSSPWAVPRSVDFRQSDDQQAEDPQSGLNRRRCRFHRDRTEQPCSGGTDEKPVGTVWIAVAAGVNEAIIFRHFSTKRELYAAIIDRKANSAAVKALRSALAEAIEKSDDRRVFETLAFHMLEFHERDDTAMRLLLYSALEGHELAEMITRNHILKTHQQMAEYVKKRMADGVFRRMDPMLAVRGFMGMVIGHVMNKKFFLCAGGQMTPKITNRQAAAAFTDLFLASMTNHDFVGCRPRRKH